MIYRFNKEKFNENASANIKKKLKYLLDDLENLVVDFSNDEVNGTLDINLYGVVHGLYPVKKEWCNIEEQLRIIHL